jgi:hypothetical protein
LLFTVHIGFEAKNSVTFEHGDAGQGQAAPNASAAAQPYLHPSLACFVLLAKFLGTPADPEQITHDRGRGKAKHVNQD